MSDSLSKKNKTLPSSINEFLNSGYQRILSYKIRHSYKLSAIAGNIMEEAVRLLYNNQLTLEDLESYLQNNIKASGININLLAQDIVGLRLYIAADYFKSNGQDVINYLHVSAELLEKYKKNAELMKQAIADEAAGKFDYNSYFYQDDTETAPKTALPVDQENNDEQTGEAELTDEDRILRLKKFFEFGLGDALGAESENISDLLKVINEELVIFLSDSDELKFSLNEILSTSKILIGKENILVDGKPIEPTGANWLKDFFHVVGSDNFDTLNIAKYVITSSNAKKLDVTLQTKLRRFLILYHNIKYFPTPFTAIPMENWEIMPGSVHGSSSAPVAPNKLSLEKSFKVPRPYSELGSNLAAPTPPTKQEKLVSTPAPASTAPTPKQTIKATPDLIETGVEADVAELKAMLLQYPEGSLERAAIEEEIKTLQKKNSS